MQQTISVFSGLIALIEIVVASLVLIAAWISAKKNLANQALDFQDKSIGALKAQVDAKEDRINQLTEANKEMRQILMSLEKDIEQYRELNFRLQKKVDLLECRMNGGNMPDCEKEVNVRMPGGN